MTKTPIDLDSSAYASPETVAALTAPPPTVTLTAEEARQLEVEQLEEEAAHLDDAR